MSLLWDVLAEGMQLQTLITAEETSIHLHIRGQSQRTALRKLQPCNLQSLGSDWGHSHTHTPVLLSEPSLQWKHTQEHTGAGCCSGCAFEPFTEDFFFFSEKWIAPLIPLHATVPAPVIPCVLACAWICVAPSSFVWAQLRGESCFACGSPSQESCSGWAWSRRDASKQAHSSSLLD